MSELNLMLMSTSNHLFLNVYLLTSLGYFLLGSYPLVTYPRTQWYVNTAIFLITLGRLEVSACGGGGGGVKEKKKGWGVVCGGGGGGGGRGRWGERREVGELCVCGRKGEVG